jgi:hypothetical protein
MKLIRLSVLLAVVSSLHFSSLCAQEAAHPLAAGSLVRASVYDLSNYKFVGTFSAVRADTLWLLQRNAPTALGIPLGSLTRLDVSRGQVPIIKRSVKGFAIGFVMGFALGAIFGNVFKGTCEDEFFLSEDKPCQNKVDYGRVALRVGVPVGIAGTLFYTLKKAERWEKVPIERMRIK